ncbi:MAG TPA: AAA family ATPase [Pirellulales bacterium]|jgi:general secretion pathway protein A
MYESHWRLRRKPFAEWADARDYYPAETHQAALLKLRYAIENRRGAAVLAGPSGVGKTLVARMLRDHLPEDVRPIAHLVFPQMPTAELLAYLAAELGAGTGDAAKPSIDASVRRIQNRLVQNAELGYHAVLIIDEAHLIDGGQTFDALRLLLNFENAAGPHATLILVGQTGLLPALGRMPQLDERLAVKCLLKPLDLEETMSYVQHRLAVAGAERTIFEPAATEVLHQLTGGSPRQINRLCDLALLVGFAEELESIGAEQIEAVSRDLVAVSAD